MAETIQTLSTKHLLGIKDLTLRDIELIFETADTFKDVLNRPIKKVPSLRDITIANIFFENSTRTRLSFELAQKRLSADIVNFTASSSSVSKGETLIDLDTEASGDRQKSTDEALRQIKILSNKNELKSFLSLPYSGINIGEDNNG